MRTRSAGSPCRKTGLARADVLHVLDGDERQAFDSHIARCADCRRELETLRPVVDRFVGWPTDVLRPTTFLGDRLARRIAGETGRPAATPHRASRWREPDWQDVAPGIACKLLATDSERRRVSMLVRLVPNASYPAHTHAGTEELHLLDGELWIDGRKLVPGDYNRGMRGEGDHVVRSDTGCTCLLVTSTDDLLSSSAAPAAGPGAC
ncbi:MAG: cupin domain-containing protein [Proteobacteria bacterium]|nr:cupin domain-containing protein [Pseudomonadota bacterium]